MAKSLVVLIIDHDTYAAEAAPPDNLTFDNEVLVSFGREANSFASHWLGYEAWMIIADAPEALVKELGFRNIPTLPDKE